MRKILNNFRSGKAFTLAEVLVSLTIGSLVLIAVLSVYNRAQRSAVAITQNLEGDRFSSEVLQRIAEDLDGITDAGRSVRITVRNKVESHGFHTAYLEILKSYYDDQQLSQTFEKIVWQGAYDYDGDSKALVLYRSHSGIAYEDKLLEQDKEKSDRELFVPVCSGLTFFAVQIPQGGQFRDAWTTTTMPAGVTVTISFAEPVKSVTGGLDVDDLDKIQRTVAIDRTRKMAFTPPPLPEDQNKPAQDANKPKEPNEPNKPGNLVKPKTTR